MQTPMINKSRRKFIQQTALATAGLSLPGLFSAEAFSGSLKTISANDKINVGLIGCKGMGWSNLRAHLTMPEANCIALADIDQRVLDERTANVKELRGNTPSQYKDYRK